MLPSVVGKCLVRGDSSVAVQKSPLGVHFFVLFTKKCIPQVDFFSQLRGLLYKSYSIALRLN